MKKLVFILLVVTSCTNSQTVATDTSTTEPGQAAVVPPAPQTTPLNPLVPLEGESRAAFLERQINQLNGEIIKLEPLVIAATNRVDPKGPEESARLKEQLFSLERQKASLELQLLSLP